MQADLAAPTPPCRAVENQPVTAQFKTGLERGMCSGRSLLRRATGQTPSAHRALPDIVVCRRCRKRGKHVAFRGFLGHNAGASHRRSSQIDCRRLRTKRNCTVHSVGSLRQKSPQRVGFLLMDQFTLVSLSSAIDPLRVANLLSGAELYHCLLYTSPSPRDKRQSRMPSSA